MSSLARPLDLTHQHTGRPPQMEFSNHSLENTMCLRLLEDGNPSFRRHSSPVQRSSLEPGARFSGGLRCDVDTVLYGQECDENRHPQRPVPEEQHPFRDLFTKCCPRDSTFLKTHVSNQCNTPDGITYIRSLGGKRTNEVEQGSKRASLCQLT